MLRSRLGASFSLSGSTGPLIGLLLLCAFLSFSTESFFSIRNFVNILDQITVLGILAVGMTFVILIGGIDLSVGSVLALCGMVMGFLAKELGWPMEAAILTALIAAGLAGVVSGILIAFFRVPAFIATLAMMSAARGLANMVSDGHQIISFPIWFNLMAVIRYGGVITITVAIMFTVFAISWAYLKFTSGGRSLYAIGGNAEVARLAGIKVKLHTVGVYVFAAVLSGIAGILLGARLDSVQPQAGVSYELDAIAAVVIGGTSLSGGTGSLVGTIIGVLIIGVLRNGLNLLGVSPFMQQVVIGLVIALAVSIEALKKK
ncbi:ABC transporter permease [Marinomonas posidonica]|uniref:ABC-type transporter, integral membrane subunit n=1 Tax=Marinomonas posidonica (strain CECT 7376 / NCIMB 14433 / IVIA-Po-181) TaxID=491952 RepID=F6CU18_MARPP|nr:ABC transporter permease [Marinomonas posidonica]AEF54070.1 ABC-type transporter, integral membrane subunit [Marinomonas posidonica IVIA-Po-181]